MNGGDRMFVLMLFATKILRKNKKYIDELLGKSYESAFNCNIIKNTIGEFVYGKESEPYIKSAISYPISMYRISTHTHPIFLSAFNDAKLAQIGYIPSNTDIIDILYASVHYKECVINAIVHTKGIVFYYCQDKLIKFLINESKEDYKDIIENYIANNIAYRLYKIAESKLESEKELFELFQKEMLEIFETPDDKYGIEMKFFDW